MAKNTIDVTIDDREVLAMIERTILELDHPVPLLKKIGRQIKAWTSEMFVGKRPDVGGRRGEKWAKLKPATIQQKKALKVVDPRRPLVKTTELRRSLFAAGALKVDKKGLEYGTDVTSKSGFPYPAIHQIGDSSRNLPKRRFLFLTKNELLYIAEMSKLHIEKIMRK